MSDYATAHLDSAVCGCGHMRGGHKAREPYPCATITCGCKGFRTRAASGPADPPRVVQGRVERELPPGTANADDDLGDLVYRKRAQDPNDALTRFARHLRGRMRVLGWDATQLQEKSGLSARTVTRAVNGTFADIATAEKIAVLIGSDLAAMVGPYQCATCAGEPPKGFRCMECGTERTAA